MTDTTLAIRPDQSIFSAYQRAVLKQLGVGDDVSNAELATYMHICQRTALDPFSGQIHLIGRYDKKAGRIVYRAQTGIDGYRVIAQRTCERTRESLGYEESLWCGKDGQWSDVWFKDYPPVAAKAIVLRNGHRFPAVAHYAEYVPTDREGRPMGLWPRMAAGQIAKCAEALALRKAFPNDMAGVYTAEEMAQADAEPHPDYRMANDPERDAAGLMTSHQRTEHAALRRMNEPPPGAVEKLEQVPDDDQWYTPEPQPEPQPEPEKAPHRVQSGKVGLDRLAALYEQLSLDDEEQATVCAWFAPGEWTASAAQVKQVADGLKGFLTDARGDVAEARTALWAQYRKVHGDA